MFPVAETIQFASKHVQIFGYIHGLFGCVREIRAEPVSFTAHVQRMYSACTTHENRLPRSALEVDVVGPAGLEPATDGLKVHSSTN
jgi:hypothetical protein